MKRNFLNAVCIVLLVLIAIAASGRIFETLLFASEPSEQACHCCGHSSAKTNSANWQPLFLSLALRIAPDSVSDENYADREVFFNAREHVQNIFHPPNDFSENRRA